MNHKVHWIYVKILDYTIIRRTGTVYYIYKLTHHEIVSNILWNHENYLFHKFNTQKF